MDKHLDELLTSHKKGNVILFVGAGVSKNLGLPDWSELINHLAKELDYDPKIFNTFGDSLALAEYYILEKGITELCQWMNNKWHTSEISNKHKESTIHELIVKAGFSTIYTTNYDRWIEKSFEIYAQGCNRIVTVEDIPEINKDIPQVIKLHGDFKNEETLVLGESSFYERFEFETALDIKLRSDVLGKSVLFIGYSLNDVNMRFLFYKLAKLWKSSSNNAIQPKSYIFSAKPNPIQKRILEQWGIQRLDSEEDNPLLALENFLERFN